MVPCPVVKRIHQLLNGLEAWPCNDSVRRGEWRWRARMHMFGDDGGDGDDRASGGSSSHCGGRRSWHISGLSGGGDVGALVRQ